MKRSFDEMVDGLIEIGLQRLTTPIPPEVEETDEEFFARMEVAKAESRAEAFARAARQRQLDSAGE